MFSFFPLIRAQEKENGKCKVFQLDNLYILMKKTTKKKRQTFPLGKNITYSSQLQKQASHIFYNTPHISTCSGGCEGGPEHLFFCIQTLAYVISLGILEKQGAQTMHSFATTLRSTAEKNFLLLTFFFTLLLQCHLTQFVSLTLTLSHAVSCQSVLQVSCTQMALHLQLESKQQSIYLRW